MGGEAAKERRRLKRLEAAAQQKNDTAESAPAEVKKTDAKGKGQGNIAQVRLQRKIARKAQGTFKPLEGQAPPPIRKRKPESSNRTPVKKFKGGDNHASSKKSNVRKNNFEAKKSNVGKDAAAKKTKPKKPKHLKRKMEQLTKAISGGVSGEGEESTVSQLEQQMQKLAKQMEEFKKIKSEKSKSSIEAQVQVTTDETTEIATGKEPDVDSISDAERVHSEEENETKRAPSSSAADEDDSSDDDDDDDDDDDMVAQVNTRSRGKRRRGRRGDEVEEDKVTKNDTNQAAAERDQSEKISSTMESTEISTEETAPPATDDEAKQSKKTPKKDDKRRCIGRKPVTDFEVNKCYSGKVQYIKPRLGAFIDIGCHSDAFIHISCISDSYISSVDEVLNVGDEVENARIVEIDREKKRITLSLRSEDKDAAKSKKGNVSTEAAEEPAEQKEEKTPLSKPKETLPVANSFVTENKAPPHSSGQKTGADLKRERKLARRAARRATQDA